MSDCREVALRLFLDDDTAYTMRAIASDWRDAVESLIARAVGLGFGWYVAYWPRCPRGIFRIKSAGGRAEWDRREWRWFGGERPRIDLVTGTILQLGRELTGPKARAASGVRFCADTLAFELTGIPSCYDVTTTMVAHELPFPIDVLPGWVKPSCGEFYPPGLERPPGSWRERMTA